MRTTLNIFCTVSTVPVYTIIYFHFVFIFTIAYRITQLVIPNGFYVRLHFNDKNYKNRLTHPTYVCMAIIKIKSDRIAIRRIMHFSFFHLKILIGNVVRQFASWQFDKFFFTRFQSWIHKTLWENMFECLWSWMFCSFVYSIGDREDFFRELFNNEFANVINETMKNLFLFNFFFVYWFS